MVAAFLTTIFALGFAIALITTFWGLVIYFWSVGVSEEGRRHGKAILFAGITSLVVLMLLFGALQWVGGKIGVEIFKTSI